MNKVIIGTHKFWYYMHTNGRNKGKHRERHDFVYKWPIINGGK